MDVLEQELFERLHRLNTQQKEQVLAFIRELTRPVGVPLRELIEFANQLDFHREDLEEMRKFIEAERERIDWDDWNNPPTLSS